MKSRRYQIAGRKFEEVETQVQTPCAIQGMPVRGRFRLENCSVQLFRALPPPKRPIEDLLPKQRDHLLRGRICALLGFTDPKFYDVFLARCIERGFTQVPIV